ncbi:PDDEXK-like family protein [Ureibacillus acetophenoni]|uniref:PD-(D/E)XK nuclease superfamily protein n=1 Tax=Ureibacillus acetophenoni TaxID=614649 RepID=A0A285UL84_9BACL|nr:PD-(D/E)XK nuclease family protein [Ureibacillus acetophenoni]SOC41001.1 PD-(D/E)XK nuclease superfamily protein [Ureibacillus acetophenoni]
MEVQKTILEYKDILENMKKFVRPKREKTVFSIGGRGHYENPISDVLAFFLDPNEEHQFDTLFLSSFIKVVGKEFESVEASQIEKIEREVVTHSGNRIDLIVESENWVLIIENKIYHSLLNPLEDYEDYIKMKYPHKQPIFALLSINEISNIPPNWTSVLYYDFISEIKKQAGPYMFNGNSAKWSFFMKDYLLNIEELIGESKVDKELVNFVQQNYNKILELIEVKDHYINSLRKMFSSILSETTGNKVEDKVHNWSKRVAIRFYCPDQWGQQSNLVLVVLPQGDFKVYFYLYGIEEELQEEENKKLIIDGFHHWKENKGTVLCYKSEERFNLDEAKKVFISTAQHLNQYFS